MLFSESKLIGRCISGGLGAWQLSLPPRIAGKAENSPKFGEFYVDERNGVHEISWYKATWPKWPFLDKFGRTEQRNDTQYSAYMRWKQYLLVIEDAQYSDRDLQSIVYLYVIC